MATILMLQESLTLFLPVTELFAHLATSARLE